MSKTADEDVPSRYGGELQGVLRFPQGSQGSPHQPAAAHTQLSGSDGWVEDCMVTNGMQPSRNTLVYQLHQRFTFALTTCKNILT